MRSEVFDSVKVSVRLMVFNNVEYIKQAIEGALNQKTNFSFEIVIGDDFSTDGTKEILKNYEMTYPKKVRVLKRPSGGEYSKFRKGKNQIANFANIIDNCKGEYIALLDGDDYWSNENKLQTQFDLLESDQSIALVFHRVNLLVNGKEKEFQNPKQFLNSKFNFLEFLRFNNFIATSSVFFRKPVEYKFPEYIINLPFADIAFYKYITSFGSFFCIDQVMGVYRIHDGGIWSGAKTSTTFNKNIDFYLGLYPNLSSEEKVVLSRKIRDLSKGYIRQNYKNISLTLIAKIIVGNLKVYRPLKIRYNKF